MIRGFIIVAVSLLLLTVAGLTALGREKDVQQPIQYNHAKHIEAGLDCSFCHDGVETQSFAGIPPLETCATCHSEPMGKSAEEPKVVEHVKQGTPIAWQRVNQLASHVFFSHRRHVTLAKLECKTCHGAMAEATTPPARPAQNLSMKWCVSVTRSAARRLIALPVIDRRNSVDLSRRNFLGLTVVSAASVAAGDGGAQLGNVLEASEKPEHVPNGVEQWLQTTCTQCPGGCGARVRLIGQRAVKLEGNPLHPITRGGLCPIAEASLQLAYNPDRLTQPLERVGARGAGGWKPITWEQALDVLANRLHSHRTTEGAETLLLMLGRSQGLAPELLRRFARAFGTPEVLELGAHDPAADALWLTQGVRATPNYDLEHARYILSFGVPLVDGWHGPVRQMIALGEIRQGTPGRRGKLVQIEPRLSATAAKADEWIPLNPGTEGALALGIGHVLVAEGLYNRAFVAEHTFGFEDNASSRGFRSILLQDYSPARVTAITGVSEETIVRLAREFARFGPGLAIGPVTPRSNTVECAIAVQSLNALLGSIETAGGMSVPSGSGLPELPEFELDGAAHKGLSYALRSRGDGVLPLDRRVDSVASWLEHVSDATKLVLLWQANPLFTDAEPGRCREALSRIPFTATITPFLDETAAYADLVLPETSFLESWDVLGTPPALPESLVNVAQPVLQPRGEARAAGEIVLALAQKLGGSIAAAFPWTSLEEVARAHADALYRRGSGSVFAGRDPSAPAAKADSADAFWQALLGAGGWVSARPGAASVANAFRTRSGRFEFYSHNLTEAFKSAPAPASKALLENAALPATDPRVFLPHHAQPLPGAAQEFPLQLLLFATLALGRGEHANQPFLQEIIGPHLNVQWESWAELNPATAATLGVADGELVWLETEHTRLQVRAKLFPGIVPGVVALPLGQGTRARPLRAWHGRESAVLAGARARSAKRGSALVGARAFAQGLNEEL
jgi:anaerobic selenocysteine-containing dehydrogenase